MPFPKGQGPKAQEGAKGDVKGCGLCANEVEDGSEEFITGAA